MKLIVDENCEFYPTHCGEYAVALHDKLRWPIYVLKGHQTLDDYDIGYVFVSDDGGKTGLDARGFVIIEEIKNTCLFVREPKWLTVASISRERLIWELGIEEDEVLAEAHQLVSDRYQEIENRENFRKL